MEDDDKREVKKQRVAVPASPRPSRRNASLLAMTRLCETPPKRKRRSRLMIAMEAAAAAAAAGTSSPAPPLGNKPPQPREGGRFRSYSPVPSSTSSSPTLSSAATPHVNPRTKGITVAPLAEGGMEFAERLEAEGLLPRLEGQEVAVHFSSHLWALLQCRLCNGLLSSPHTINECLHTFCKPCIDFHILDRSTCPICDIKLPLQLDAVLFPDPIDIMSLIHEQGPEATSRKRLERPQQSSSATASSLLEVPTPSPPVAVQRATTTSASSSQPTETLSLRLTPHPGGDLPRLAKSFLIVPSNIILAILKRFLRLRLSSGQTRYGQQVDMFLDGKPLPDDNKFLRDYFTADQHTAIKRAQPIEITYQSKGHSSSL